MTSLLVSGGFVVIIWIITIIRWERGKFTDGTVLRHFYEEMTRIEKDINNTTITGKLQKRRIPYTMYCTEIRFDNGKTVVFKSESAANHIKLIIGDKVRY